MSFDLDQARDLLAECDALGIGLTKHGDQLRIETNCDVPDGLLARLTAAKPSLLRLLESTGHQSTASRFGIRDHSVAEPTVGAQHSDWGDGSVRDQPIAEPAMVLDDLLAAIDRLTDQLRERLLTLGRQLGWPAVQLDSGRCLIGTELSWQRFINAHLPYVHPDVALLARLLLTGKVASVFAIPGSPSQQ